MWVKFIIRKDLFKNDVDLDSRQTQSTLDTRKVFWESKGCLRETDHNTQTERLSVYNIMVASIICSRRLRHGQESLT